MADSGGSEMLEKLKKRSIIGVVLVLVLGVIGTMLRFIG